MRIAGKSMKLRGYPGLSGSRSGAVIRLAPASTTGMLRLRIFGNKEVQMRLPIDRLDHIVLTVTDQERSLGFYRDALGIGVESFDNGRLALRIGEQKINIHVSGQEFAPYAAKPVPGAGDFCLITPMPVADIAEELKKQGISIELGPVLRAGSLGKLNSIYLRDPDGNLVEIANQLSGADG